MAEDNLSNCLVVLLSWLQEKFIFKEEITTYQDAFLIPDLETNRLILRKHKEEDAKYLEEYTDDPEIKKFYDGWIPHGQELSIIKAWYADGFEEHGFFRWCIALKEDDRCIGGIYLFLPYGDDKAGRRMDIGYELSPTYRNKGYISEAIRRIAQYGFQSMGLKRIQSQIIPENIASIRACEKAGFIKEGILRNFCHYQVNGQCLRTMVMMSCIPSDIGL